MKKIHFVGIGGSGISGISILAKKQGFEVTGCDLEMDTDYLKKVRESGIDVKLGHDPKHLSGIDLLVVSPAIMYQNPEHPEVVAAHEKGILLTWEEFLGKFLQKGKEVICIAGTHGKSTTTALTSLVFEKSGKDPNVIIGAKIKEWDANFRAGKSDLFITEADEFNDNFLNYNPAAIILNNVEFDHPDFFKSYDEVQESFSKFLNKLSGRKILVVNQDSKGISDLFERLGSDFVNSLNTFGYTFSNKPLVNVKRSYKIDILGKNTQGTSFSIEPIQYRLNIPGEYNVANSAGVIVLAKQFGISGEVVKNVLEEFKGIGRRLELIGEKNGIKVYDDYGHHPTAIKATIGALRQIYPSQEIIVLDEPHSYSRTKAVLAEYKDVFEGVDKVVIGPIFKARDNETFGISNEDIVKTSGHKNIESTVDSETAVEKIINEAKSGDIILVMGAGKSYMWAKKILENLL